MKRINELGISPAPWGVIGVNEKWREVMDTNAEVVCSPRNKSDARLIAAAPELYEALTPFVSLTDWMLTNAAKLGILDMASRLREHGDRARAALAKAAEESEVKKCREVK